MDIVDITVVGSIICLAGAVQSAVGFGYALFATPLLLWAGMPLPSAITLVATCSMIQAIIGARTLHATVPWRLACTATAIRLTSVILGLLLLKKLVGLDTAYIRATVGGILCILVLVQLIWRPQPVKTMHWGWGGIAFIGSGLLAGVCGMGGPPLVLWSMAHDWPTQRTRGFLFAVFATSIPVQIVLLGLTFGASVLSNAAIGVAFLPLVYLGASVGLSIGNRIARDKLRLVAHVILFVIGIGAVLPVILTHMK